ncbi:MAG: hypothetical protein KBT76_14535 [Sulfitobacter litoralis]|uniref:hypothetical protein n=1 Tax=Sulfitobacter litoralis TaxID=335975 RepID=UPI001428BC2F|nr:hypothetical protein [Sulfitobacter litoralis]MBQ0717648.1 hypothetical protein [Sulfitobacter litoralis]MBQ0802946.1 hypothetical protein [Sulfitobacter litoralis]
MFQVKLQTLMYFKANAQAGGKVHVLPSLSYFPPPHAPRRTLADMVKSNGVEQAKV